jgi:hypothetical protein
MLHPIPNNYNHFKELVKTHTITNYYHYIYHYRQEILNDCQQTTQTQTAKDLNISPAKFNGIVAILKEIPNDC